MMAIDLNALHTEFDKNKVHWRAQTLTSKGDKAMALAYIDSRDVQERLDAVCGPENWQAEHYDCGDGKLGCRIGIKVNDEWVWKGDGAGNTDVEAEKGAFSSAFKRAAVLWGVGRYLYDLPAPWVPCETYTGRDGKPRFKKFTADPWDFCKRPTGAKPVTGKYTVTELKKKARELGDEVRHADDYWGLVGLLNEQSSRDVMNQLITDLPQWWAGDNADSRGLQGLIEDKKAELYEKEQQKETA
jgi:hypothetical protein